MGHDAVEMDGRATGIGCNAMQQRWMGVHAVEIVGSGVGWGKMQCGRDDGSGVA